MKNQTIVMLSIAVAASIIGGYYILNNTPGKKTLHKKQQNPRSEKTRFFPSSENPSTNSAATIFQKYPDNYCTNNIPVDTLDSKDYLREFAKGPCSPTTLTPGIAGTKLRVLIQCEKLRDFSPEIFSSCGWNRCSYEWYESWKWWIEVPKNEYNLWIPEIWSSETPINTNTRNCFTSLIGKTYLYMKESNDVKDIKVPGLDAEIYGETPMTSSDSDCLMTSVTKILYPVIYLNYFKYFEVIRENLARMGYVSGLTMQALPMDFRQSYQMNNLSKKMMSTVKNMKDLTGKKVVMIAHSLGNLNMYYNLMRIPTKTRQKYVERVVSIAPPFLGSVKVLQDFSFGTAEYFKWNLGIDFEHFGKVVGGLQSMYEQLPTDTYWKHHDKEWIKQILRRKDYENLGNVQNATSWYNETDSKPFPFQPNRSEICNNITGGSDGKNVTQNSTHSCRLDLFDYKTFIEINGTQYGTNNLTDFFQDHGITKDGGDLYDWTRNKGLFSDFVNPEIEWTVIFASHMDTLKWAKYNNDLPLDNHNFIDPDEVMNTYGDSTVSTISSTTAFLKWAWEFDNKKKINELTDNSQDPKPVTFVHVCSEVKQRGFYDSVSKDGVNLKTKNDYIGLGCMCTNESDKGNCDHMNMVEDEYLVQYLAEILVGGVRSKLPKNVNNMTNREFFEIKSSCKVYYEDKLFDGKSKKQKVKTQD